MSSARANASARNRRAGGDMPPPPQMQGRPGQPMQQQQMQMPAKLSVSDAIALITLRLGRVEQIVQNMPVDGQSAVGADGENIRIVDNEVFEHMAQRLDELEKGQQELAARKPIVSSTPTPVTQVVNTAVSKEVSESIEVLKAEMVQVKDLLLNLQSFTMQTNQRLSEIVFNGGEFIETIDDTDGIISGNIVDDALQSQSEEVVASTSLEESA
jgi:hypothetical protein